MERERYYSITQDFDVSKGTITNELSKRFMRSGVELILPRKENSENHGEPRGGNSFHSNCLLPRVCYSTGCSIRTA